MPVAASSDPTAKWPRAILHLDMDAFYVNVHLQEHPEDQGLPLVVGGQPAQRGVVTSASYEARALGIHSAMPTGRALRIVPQLKIVPADWPRIKERSRQVMEVLRRYGPVEKMSVDEAYIDLSEYDDPVHVAREVKRDVGDTTGLPCSIGLASSKLVAKIASDHDKPDGFTIVRQGKEAAFLAPKPTRAILGIGPRTAERLASVQILTCGQLAAASPEKVQSVLGRQAAGFIRRAQGIDSRTVRQEPRQVKSISQEWTFNQDINDPEILLGKLETMCKTVADSLRDGSLVAHTVTVKIRWTDFTTFTRQKSFEHGVESAADILRIATALWRENWRTGQFVRLLGVGVSNLEMPQVRQLQLPFDSEA